MRVRSVGGLFDHSWASSDRSCAGRIEYESHRDRNFSGTKVPSTCLNSVVSPVTLSPYYIKIIVCLTMMVLCRQTFSQVKVEKAIPVTPLDHAVFVLPRGSLTSVWMADKGYAEAKGRGIDYVMARLVLEAQKRGANGIINFQSYNDIDGIPILRVQLVRFKDIEQLRGYSRYLRAYFP